MIKVSLQNQTIDVDQLRQGLLSMSNAIGAITEFTGVVRADDIDGQQVKGVFLEHYPQMTEKALLNIVESAMQRWALSGVYVCHRIGYLPVGESILYVGIASSHRKQALQAMDFLLDYLKNDVPLWKKAILDETSFWIEKKASDIAAKSTWE